MFGKPELADGQQPSGSRTVVPSQMPSMPMQVKPGVPTGATNFVVSPEYVMPKGEDYEKSAFDEELENLAQILDETFDVKVGRTLSSRNMSKLKTVLETLQDIVSSAEKDVESKSDYLIPVKLENAFETKQLLDPIFDYHRVESHVTEDGIVITTEVTQEFIEAIGVAEKALGRTLSGGLGKLGRAGRGAVNFDPKAWDGDGDGIVQEGTPYSRPAIPGVNDRASGGRVDTNAATRAWQNQRRSGMASRMGSDDNADEYDEAMGPPMRRPSRGMADDPVGDAASENLDRDRNAGAVRSGLSSSTAGVVKIDIPQIDNAIEELAAKDIGMSLKRFRELTDEGRLPERYQKAFSDRVKVLNDIFSNLSKEKLDESPGKVLSEIRKKLVDTLSSDDKEGDGFISQFNDRREIQNFIDGIEEVLNLAFDDYVDRARENGTGEEADDLQAELLSDFTQSLKKISEKSKNLFDARTRSFRGTEPAKAKKESESEKERLFDLLKNPLDMESLAGYLDSTEGVVPTDAFLDRIRKGNIDDEDLVQINSLLEDALENIITLDPSLDPEKLAKEFSDAFREGAKNDESGVIQRIAKELGDDGVSEELVQYLKDGREGSPFLPSRGKKEREILRGFASRTGSGDSRGKKFDVRDRKQREDKIVEMYNDGETVGDISRFLSSQPGSNGIFTELANIRNVIDKRRKAGDVPLRSVNPNKERQATTNLRNEIIRLYNDNDELSYREIAKLTGTTQANVTNTLSSMRRGNDSRIRSGDKVRGFSSSTGSDGESGLGSSSDKREMDMTLAEYAELNEVLKKYMDESQLDGIGADEDMQVIQNILDKLDESSAANDSIPLTDKEIDEYMDTLTRMRDNGPVEDSDDKESIDKLIDSLKKTKESIDGTYESDALQKAGMRLSVPSPDQLISGRGRKAKRPRGFKSSNGTINPHKKLDIELDDSEIGELRDELQGFMKMTDNPAPLRAIAEKLEKATNGKFSVDKDEYEAVIKEIDKMRTDRGVVTSDVVGVLEQAAESQKGKYSSIDVRGGRGFESSTGGGKNNGAPSDIPETMQKQLIMWGRQQGGLRLVQEAIQRFDKDKGTMPASYWKRLRTMYENMGPGSASGAARRTGRRGIFGRGKDTDTSPRGSAGFIIDDRPVPKGLLDNTMSNNPIVTDDFVDTNSGPMGGSQGGGVFKDPKTGKEYYIKPPKSQTHAENESLMSRFYERLGIPAGKVKVGTYKGRPKIVSEMVPGAKQVDHESEIKNSAWKKAVQDTFVANAWLANWDAVSNSGNTIKGGDGKAYVIDVGGAGLFRARGEAKGSAFGPIVGEMESLRDPNQSGARRGVAYWGDIPPAEIARQVKAIGAVSDSEIKEMVDAVISDKGEAKKLSDTLIARRDYLVQNWSTGKNSGTGRRGRTGFSSETDNYERRNKRPGVAPAMRPADFEVRPRDGEPTGVGKGGVMGTKPDPKFTGDSFDQAKPEEWEKLTIDEKWGWMLGEGNPEKGGTMSPAAYQGAMRKLGEEEAREETKRMTPEERRKSRSESRQSAMDERSDNEKERLTSEREERQKEAQESSKRVKEEATAEQAKAKRQARLDAFNEWIDDSIRELSGMEYDETDINPDSEDIWDTVSTILGVEDITPKSLKEAIDELSSYIDITSGENAYEKKSVARANALLKKLLKMQSEYSEDKWFNDREGGVSGFQSSTGDKPRPPRDGRPARPGTPETPQSNAKREGEIKKLSTLIEQVVAELDEKRQNPSPKKGRMGFSSSTGKTMITDEATFFKDIENSLAKEIRAAQKARNTKAASGLTKLQEIIKRSEASKTGDRRTNVGSIYMTMDEVDLILDGLQFALDQQVQAGGDKRIGWYSRLIEKVAGAAMSTFIDKSTSEIGSTRRTVTNKDGVKKKINIVPEA
jgi:hypothetical protein